jgi:hypothetical protein
MEVATLRGTIKIPFIVSVELKALGIIIIREKRNQSDDILKDLMRSLRPHEEKRSIDVKRNEKTS